MRKLDLLKKRDENNKGKQVVETVLKIDQQEQVKELVKVKDSIDSLYQLINGQKPLDISELTEQLELLNKRLDFKDTLRDIVKSVDDSKVEVVTVKDFSKLLKAVEQNKPLPLKVDLTSLEKAIIRVEQRIQQETTEPDQSVEGYQPVRRVIKVGNRLVFDDQPTPSRGGGGGSSRPTILYAVITQSGAGTDTLVSAVANHRIKVVGYVVVMGSAGTVTFKSGTTALTGAMSFAANGGASSAGTENFPVFATGTNEALNITSTGAAAQGHLSYILE